MDIITWTAVGLVVGVSAWLLVHESRVRLRSSIAFGIAGAFVGSTMFRELDWHARFSGLAGVITVAFAGAVAVLVGLQLVVGMKRTRLRR